MKFIPVILLYCLYMFFLVVPVASSAQRDMVFVSILPQKYFVQQISGNTLDVEVMVQPGASPATYEPKPSQMRKLAVSRAYFAIGVPFENVWLAKIAGINPDMHVVHTDKTIDKVAMAAHFHGNDDHHQNNHLQGGENNKDPHIWLAPTLVKKQAAIIHANLIKLFPERAPTFTVNFNNFSLKIDKLHIRLQQLLRGYQGREFMVFHPSWGYFAREYGLRQVAIEIEGKNPKPAQIRELIEYAQDHGIRAIFAQQQFSQKSARIIAREIHGEVISIDPLAEDWYNNMEEIGVKFKKAMQ